MIRETPSTEQTTEDLDKIRIETGRSLRGLYYSYSLNKAAAKADDSCACMEEALRQSLCECVTQADVDGGNSPSTCQAPYTSIVDEAANGRLTDGLTMMREFAFTLTGAVHGVVVTTGLALATSGAALLAF